MMTERKLDSQIVVNRMLDMIYNRLEELDSPEYEHFFINDKSKQLTFIDVLIEQIHTDMGVGNLKSAFRKAGLLLGMLNRVK